jgi:hypothetical protein
MKTTKPVIATTSSAALENKSKEVELLLQKRQRQQLEQ